MPIGDDMKWIEDAFEEARKIFGVAGPEWSINLNITDKPGGDNDNGGFVHNDTAYYNVDMEINSELAEGPKGKRIVYHEVLHVAHSEVDPLVYKILHELPEDKAALLGDLYSDMVERFIQRISWSIVETED